MERRDALDDAILSARLWFDGRYESQVSIAGAGEDPMPGLIGGVVGLLQPYLAPSAPQGSQDVPALVQGGHWQEVLGL